MKHKPPSPNRLLHYSRPLVMAGDPQWYGLAKDPWQARQKAVYEQAMKTKHSAKGGNDPAGPENQEK